MFRGPHRHAGCAALAAILFLTLGIPAARALEFSATGYVDLRLVAPPRQTSWLDGGLSKFRYGDATQLHFAEAVMQADLTISDDLEAITVLRVEPRQDTFVDALETYLSWHPAREGDFSWAVKAGAFFPTISLENDDLGWASPYTLTPSAINSWIGEELRTIGSEATFRWHTQKAGTVSAIAAILCCNDPAGILMADRGWAMGDRAIGLLERVRLPDSTIRIFRQVPPGTTGMFEEIDGRPGWYAGLNWLIPGVGKLSVLRYDNQGDPTDHSINDTAWDTRFYSGGFRTQFDSLVLIAQALRGQTVVIPRPGIVSDTKFESAFLLASYDLDDWRVSARHDWFHTTHVNPTPHVMSEDGTAVTLAISWSQVEWLRVTGEVVAMSSRRLQYLSAGSTVPRLAQAQYQLSTRFFY